MSLNQHLKPAVRKDTGASLVPTDGDPTQLQVDSTGNLRVTFAGAASGDGAIVDGVTGSIRGTVFDYTNSNPVAVRLTDTNGDYIAAGAGTQYTEDAVTPANPIGTALAVRRRDALAGETTADGDWVIANATDKGELYVKHVDTVNINIASTGTAVPVTDNASSLTIDATSLPLPTGASTSANQTTIIGHLDGVEGLLTTIDADTGTLAGAVSGTEMQVDVVTMPSVAQATASNLNAQVVGSIAHDSADSGNPVKVGFKAINALPTAVANNDRSDGVADLYGAQYVRTDHPSLWSYHEDSSSALTDTEVKAAPGLGLSVYVTDIIVSLGAATALNIFFEESTTKVLGPYYLEGVSGRGVALSFKTPKKVTANTALTVTTSAAVAHSIDVLGFIAP